MSVRRLYSSFAGGWPGTGLLLLRLAAGAMLVARGAATLTDAPHAGTTAPAAILSVCGLLLILGLWTPLAGTAAALGEILHVLTTAAAPVVSLLVGTIAGSLAMLGPGLWSIDARLFGWRRVEPAPRARPPV